MITFISSILAFIAGGLATLTCLVHCSSEGLERFINTLHKVREEKQND